MYTLLCIGHKSHMPLDTVILISFYRLLKYYWYLHGFIRAVAQFSVLSTESGYSGNIEGD